MRAAWDPVREHWSDSGDEKGFTLIEVLIVILILGILAGIVVFAVQNLSSSSAQTSCGSDLKTVETAVEAYKAQLGAYPGGAVASGWALNPAAAAGYPASFPNANTLSMEALLGTATNAGTTVGPWLKDTPYNPGHYAIVLLDDGSGTIQVTNGAGTVVAAGCPAVP
jgi:general secretion pathway protein G